MHYSHLYIFYSLFKTIFNKFIKSWYCLMYRTISHTNRCSNCQTKMNIIVANMSSISDYNTHTHTCTRTHTNTRVFNMIYIYSNEFMLIRFLKGWTVFQIIWREKTTVCLMVCLQQTEKNIWINLFKFNAFNLLLKPTFFIYQKPLTPKFAD